MPLTLLEALALSCCVAGVLVFWCGMSESAFTTPYTPIYYSKGKELLTISGGEKGKTGIVSYSDGASTVLSPNCTGAQTTIHTAHCASIQFGDKQLEAVWK